MWRNKELLVIFLVVTGFSVAPSVQEALVVGGNEQFFNLDQLGDVEKNTILLPEFENDLEKEVLVQESENMEEEVKFVSQSKTDAGENEGFRLKRRTRRQLPTGSQLLLLSVSQECDGIILRWKSNIPFSPKYHTSNSEFIHFNIYRETNYFTSVAGLTPIASGKDLPELKKNHIYNAWTDKFPPTDIRLVYAVTVVDKDGKETPIVVPKQITFLGGIEKTGVNPTLIIPNILKGDVLHHSVALNKIRDEYMVAFDLDVNKDGRPDQLFAIRVNSLGQIIDRRILNATVGIASTEQGRPSVTFNPVTQKYLIAFQVTAPALLGGVSVIIGQKVFSHRTDRYQNPYVLVKATGKGGVRVAAFEPKIIYNSATGGFAMSVMIDSPPKRAFAVAIATDGKLSAQPLFAEVFDVNLFMDTKAREVYFVYQVQQWAATFVDKTLHSKVKSYSYLVVLTRMNTTGGLLPIGPKNTVRFLVGFTREKHSNIDGYINEEKGCLTVFWNNEENGKKRIESSNIFSTTGNFIREENVHNCPTRSPVQNPASCFLPNNKGHILLWEEGSKVGGFLVKDDTFHPVLGEQRRPLVVYNQQQQRAFAVWQQKVGGNFMLYVRNVHPGSQFSCRTACKLTEKCAMNDVCAPRNPVVSVPTCAQNKGGCSHTCLPLSNGRKCSCPLSHSLSLDEMTCFLKDTKPDVTLLYSSMGSIWSVSVYYKDKRTSFARIPIQGQHIVSFFYNKKDKYLYWADSKAKTINRALSDGSKKDELFNSQIIVPDGMVVDIDAKHLFWTDMILKSVFRSSLDGNSRVPFVSALDKPRALTLHQKNKWLYWSDWGTVPKIERINTDGSGRKIVVINGLGWPNGLTVDVSHLYWVDAKLDKMEMSDLDGQHRLVITKQGLLHPYGIGIAGNRLYWTDWAGDIRSVDKTSSTPSIDIIAAGITKPFGLQVYDGTVVVATFCTDPGVPSFGGRNPAPGSGGKYKIGERVIFTCNPGLVHLGSNERHCLPTGKWDGKDTQCKALPVFTIIPQNKTTNVGNTVSLACTAVTASGQKAKIQWHKNGKKIQFSPRHTVMPTVFLIFNVVVDDTGTYTCMASNAAGDIKTSMYLRIKSQSVADCGKAKFQRSSKIRGGQRATPGSIPWQIMLWDKTQKRPFCGGSLLNARWGITAAHCLKHFQFSDIEVFLGKHVWGRSEKTEQKVSIDTVHLYPQYTEKTYNSDIALFHFKKDIIMTDYIKPICLPVTQTYQALLHPGTIGIISGWGARRLNKNNKTRSVRKLHEVKVPIVSQASCTQNHHTYVVTPNMFCAGLLNGKADACKGDSGGPLTVEHKTTGRSVLLGIVSWGDKKCGAKNKYGVYTKVQNYISWINGHIKIV